MKKFLAKLPALCLLAALLCAPSRVWAHGDEDHGDSASAAAPAVSGTGSGATQTDLEIHLEDLNASSAGTSAPLVGAKVRGFLKHDDGDLLSRISAVPGKTPGYYEIRFSEDAQFYRFSEAGRYLLELHVSPAQGEPFDTTIPIDLPATNTTNTIGAPPLWKRLLLPMILVLVAGALIWFLMKRRNRGKGDDNDDGEVVTVKKPLAPITETITISLLCLALAGVGATTAWAHGDEDHSAPEPVAATAPATMAVSPNIVLGETTSTVKAGNIRVTLMTHTVAAPPDVLAPGEVKLPAQTAQLLNIKTAPVTVAQLATGIAVTGQIAANQNDLVRVASLVPGRVTRLNIKQGDKVSKGQIVAIVESRAVGEAQSAYAQAAARLANAKSNFNVVEQQAKAGVFSRAPLEAARRAQAEAAGNVREGQAAVQGARVALDTVTRTASAGGYANPALEAARAQSAQATEALQSARAALTNAKASVQSAGSELARRQQLAKSGAYVSRPVQEAQRSLVAAQSARAAAQSEVATTRANLSRAKTLIVDGLVSGRDLEAAQQAFDTATARLETAQADEKTSQQELSRQQQIAGSDVNNVAEVGAARAALAQTQADARTREAEVGRAASGVKLAGAALGREQKIFGANVANRSQLGTARAGLQSAQAGLYKAQRGLEVANSTLARERSVYSQGLNNTAQVQAARSVLVSAQADADAARSTLKLLQSSPGGSVDVPVRAPIAGIVQSRDVALGELVQSDAPLMTIVNLGSVAVEAALFEGDAARVSLDDAVAITSDAAPGRTFNGRISFLGSQVDPTNRTITARATLDNPGNLRPGVFVRGQIQTGTSPLSLSVPTSAVLEDGAAKIVFIAKGDHYERREVTTGIESGGRVAIQSGVKQGEIVVTDGASALRAQAARAS